MDLIDALTRSSEVAQAEADAAVLALMRLRVALMASMVMPLLLLMMRGSMQLVPAGSEERAASNNMASLAPAGAGSRDSETSFAVIHDEPYLTIVFEDGEFKGHIVDATLDKLEEARVVAAQYHLVIDHVRSDNHTNFVIHLSEKNGVPAN